MVVRALGAIQNSRPPEIVIPRRRGSSTPRPFGSITAASGILDPRRSLSSGGHSADPLAGMTAGYDFAISRHVLPEVCIFRSPPPEIRGRREDRVHAAPAVSCAVAHMKTRTRAYRFSGNTPAFPAQWLYGLLRALPSERLFCHCRRARREPLRNLTPAPRRQDHTTSPYASCALVFCAIRVHRIPPRVRDDREPPLVTGETRGIKSLICPTPRAEYFCARVWTA